MQQQQQQEQIKTQRREQFRWAMLAAYAMAALVILGFVASFMFAFLHSGIVAETIVSAIFGIVSSLLMLCLVAILPCPSWARACGYGARFIHIVAAILMLNGMSALTLMPLISSGAAIGAIWIIVVSWRYKGYIRVVGLPLALFYIVLSFHVAWTLQLVVLIPGLLNLVWLLLIADFLHKEAKSEPVAPKEEVSSFEWS